MSSLSAVPPVSSGVFPKIQHTSSLSEKILYIAKNSIYLIADFFKLLFCYGKNQVFGDACSGGHDYTVKWLSRWVDVHKDNDDFLIRASLNDRIGVVSFLALTASEESVENAFRDPFPNHCSLALLEHISSERLQEIDDEIWSEADGMICLMRMLVKRPFPPELPEALARKGLRLEPAFQALLEMPHPEKALDALIPAYENVSGQSINALRISPFAPLLIAAIHRKNENMVRYLSSREEIDANVTFCGDTTPLLEACSHRFDDEQSFRMVELLLSRKPNLHAKDARGKTALTHACINGFTKTMNLLIREDRSLLQEKDLGGMTALMHACHNLDENPLARLLTMCSNEVLIQKDRVGETAVHHAIARGMYPIFEGRLDAFNRETKESFVLKAFSIKHLKAAHFFLCRGCGIEKEDFSPDVQRKINEVCHTSSDFDFLEAALRKFNEQTKKESHE